MQRCAQPWDKIAEKQRRYDTVESFAARMWGGLSRENPPENQQHQTKHRLVVTQERLLLRCSSDGREKDDHREHCRCDKHRGDACLSIRNAVVTTVSAAVGLLVLGILTRHGQTARGV